MTLDRLLLELSDVMKPEAGYTAISADRSPLHYHAEVAVATTFGEIVVQGGVITAILYTVVAEDRPGPWSVFLHTDLALRAPTRTGATIIGTARGSRCGSTSRSLASP